MPTRSPPPDLSLAEQVCLALVVQGVSHGWALGTLLAPDGEVGRVYTLSRPLTYRAIDGLVDRRLVRRRSVATGGSRQRALLSATTAGRRACDQWLDTPVEHLRDVRTELLVKLTLRARAGRDSEALVRAQQERFAPLFEALTPSDQNGTLVELWRSESARAVRRFLERALHPQAEPATPRPELRLSARNQLAATVAAVHHGEVMSTVTVELPDGQRLTAAITRDAAEDLRVGPDDPVTLVVKATDVMLAR